MTNVKTIEQIALGIENGTQKTLTENDSFQFGCTACGKCCFGQDILLNPADVYLMVRSNFAKKVGIRTTHDLFENGYLTLIRGHNSKAPLCMIRVEKKGGPCPFLVPTIDVNDAETAKKLTEHVQNGVPAEEALKRLGLSINRFLCGLHEDRSKPAVCKSSPIGRVHTGREPQYIVMPPVPDCPGMESKATQVVKEWIAESKLDVQYRHSTWFHDLLTKHHEVIKKMDGSIAYMLGAILFDIDGAVGGNDADAKVPTAFCANVDEYMAFVAKFAETYMGLVLKNGINSMDDIRKIFNGADGSTDGPTTTQKGG